MSKQKSAQKVLLIAAGPSSVGQSGECDIAVRQACLALKSTGRHVVLVDANPANLALNTADQVYIQPLNRQLLTDIIRLEQPDALLPTAGGGIALHLTRELCAAGVLNQYGVTLLGMPAETLEQTGDCIAFKDLLRRCGFDSPEYMEVSRIDQAEFFTEKNGFPVLVKGSYGLAGSHSGLAFNVEELRSLVAERLSGSAPQRTLVEAPLIGWQQIEIEVLRDTQGRKVLLGIIEYLDPVGIHSGDAVCVLPAQSLTQPMVDQFTILSFELMDALALAGSATIRVGFQGHLDEIRVLDVTPRLTRASAFVSLAVGVAVGQAATLLAVGKGLDEIPFGGDKMLGEFRWNPSAVMVKVPCWDFHRLEGVPDWLGIPMRSTGAAVGIGSDFKEAFKKAVRAVEQSAARRFTRQPADPFSLPEILNHLATPSSRTYALLLEALRRGAEVDALVSITAIAPWFIEQFRMLTELEKEICQHQGGALPSDLIKRAKRAGFGDSDLAAMTCVGEELIRQKRIKAGIHPGWGVVAAGISAIPTIRFISYQLPVQASLPPSPAVVLLGCGPKHIGMGAEREYALVTAADKLADTGRRPVLINCDPYAVSLSMPLAGQAYCEPLCGESIATVCQMENSQMLMTQFHGTLTQRWIAELAGMGLTPMDFKPEVLALTEDRSQWTCLVHQLGVPQPNFATVLKETEAMRFADENGYPIWVQRTSDPAHERVLIMDPATLKELFENPSTDAGRVDLHLEAFLEYAIECEVDVVSDGTNVCIPEVMEQIELAGVHSGDSACVMPPYSTPPRHVDTIAAYAEKIAQSLDLKGLMTLQFAVLQDTVYLLGACPGASRTVPLTSMVCDLPLAELAVQVSQGAILKDLAYQNRRLPFFAVKASLLPFDRFPDLDPLLGPVMRSTGQVAAIADSFAMAYYRSQEACQFPLPMQGCVLITVTDADKPSIMEPARLFKEMGFEILATRGTHDFLTRNGIAARVVRKLGYGRPDLMDAIKTGQIALVINTPSGRQSQQDDAHIRQAAIRYRIPNITTPAGALAAAKAIAARKRGKPPVRPLSAYRTRG